MLEDVPLSDVQVIWDYDGKEPDAPPLIVMGHPDEHGRDARGTRDNDDYSSSWGACNADYLGANDDERLLMLFEKFQELVTFEGLAPAVVHRAFCVVPEYRISLIWRGLGSHIPTDLRNQEAEEQAIERMHARAAANEQRRRQSGRGGQ